MKRIILSGVIVLFLFSCSNTAKLLRKGQYYRAFTISLHRVIRHPDKTTEINTLVSAYKHLQDEDENRLRELKLSGQPTIWEEIYNIYTGLDSRQKQIKPVLPLKGYENKIKLHDYAKLRMEAKKKAAEYFYAHAKVLLSTRDKNEAQQAYYELKKVAQYFRPYKDVDRLLVQAKNQGMKLVALYISPTSKNRYSKYLNQQILRTFLNIDVARFDKEWVVFRTFVNPPKDRDYSIIVDIDRMMVSPEDLEKNNYKLEKEVQDGTQYVLDANGNVQKDSAGNDMKVPKYVKVFNYVKTFHLHKEAHVEGHLILRSEERHDNMLRQIVKADHIFDYQYAVANGDKRALDDKTRRLIKNKPMGFPPDPIIVGDALETLKAVILSIVESRRQQFN